jgi:DNA-binding transcriptional LysR family regulator
MVLKHLENQGISPNIVMQCESFMEVKSAVKAGSGLGILYQDIAVPDVVDRDLKVLDIPELKIEFDTFIVYHKERPLSPSALEFLTLLKQWPRKARWVKPF